MKRLTNYKFKMSPFEHQLDHFVKYKDQKFHGLLWDMGTGKTKQFLDVACDLHERGKIETLIIIAPNGVHIDHVRIASVAHVPDRIKWCGAAYSSTMNKSEKRDLEGVLHPDNRLFKIVTFNTDALKTKRAFDAINQLLDTRPCMMVVDEFMDFKNPTAQRSKQLLKLAHKPLYKYICDGTPVNQSPTDLFVGYQFLSNNCLGFNSFLAFKNRYVKLENRKFYNELLYTIKPDCAGMEEATLYTRLIYDKRKEMYLSRAFLLSCLPESSHKRVSRILQLSRAAYWMPTGVKNLDELKERVYQFSSRVNKSECLDLPEKLYVTEAYELDKDIRSIYERVKKELFASLADGREITVSNILTQYLRLQQIIGGYIRTDDGELSLISDLRFNLMLERISRQPASSKTIIWARFKHEIKRIEELLQKTYGENSAVTYYGETKKEDKAENKKRFMKEPECRFFISNPRAGGVGVDGLQVASYMYFFSRDFSLRYNKQAEDRGHRAGQVNNLTIVSIMAKNTIDERIQQSLDKNQKILDMITGDHLYLLQN